MEQAASPERTCPQCGRRLSAGEQEGLCAACLLTAGSETLTFASTSVDDAPTVSMGGAAPAPGVDAVRLEPGATWGAYRIGRLLGRGGMGEVYEAEHTSTGRRLALKLLRRRLHDVEDRARFLREGQLAASVSHPHTVYIFGSEEIGGMPAISMELLPGGTLKDRVVARGPMSPEDAVSAVLDIVGGLDAAQAAGILHRDIKPSNCFIDAEGSVKVGDFGLSISTLARDVRTDGAPEGFEGTPQFAAPEQLRGEPLDVRADIYAVGATLYYLLTGQPPFDGRDLRELVEQVTSEPPASPRRLRGAIPSGLAVVVLRCLEKSPERRPASYAALADALRPYSARDVTPARPGVRLVAGVLDSAIMAVVLSVWKMGTLDIMSDPLADGSGVTWSWLFSLAYFLGLEGAFGTTIGKRLLGLRLAATGAGWWPRVALRTSVYFLPRAVVTLGVLAFGPIPWQGVRLGANVTLNTNDMRELFASTIVLAITAALFSTMRRNNGWAAVHDLISGMRVVARSPTAARRGAATAGEPAEAAAGRGARIGPFDVLSAPARPGEHGLVIAFDPVLRRKVWIRQVPDGTPPVDARRRDVSRIGRLHWLTGRRSDREHWDAFEAPAGEALLARVGRPADWPTLKPWLLDLAHELETATKDGSLPELGLDRLWLRGDGHLVLLDFRAPGLEAVAPDRAGGSNLTPVELLAALSRLGKSATADVPAPLSARRLLDRLDRAAPPSLQDAAATLAALAPTPDRTGRLRRAIPIALASVPLMLMVIFTLLLLPVLGRFFGSQNNELLEWLELLRRPPAAGSRMADPAVRDAVETYVAGRYGTVLRDESLWRSRMMQSAQMAEWRGAAESLLARHPSVDAAETSRAAALIAPELERSKRLRANRPNTSLADIGAIIGSTLVLLAVVLVLALSLVSALVAPGGGVTRMLGLAVVTRDGAEIGRGRSLARTLVAWLPAIAWIAYLLLSPKIRGWVPAPPWPGTTAGVMLGILAVGAALTIARPARGPHDRLMGTWVVPR